MPAVRVAFPTRLEGTAAEIVAEKLFAAVLKAGEQALRRGGAAAEIDAVSFCIFSSGVVVTDARNRAVTPVITHADRRSSAVALELVRKHPREWWLDHTGNLPYPGGIGSSTLAWLRQERGGVFRKGYQVGQVSTYLGGCLTGRRVSDPSQAVFLGLWDIRRNRWSEEACRAVGIEVGALPEVAWADSILGGLTASVARRWGALAGTPVVGGFVDTSAAVIQTPMDVGQLAHNAGSTDVLALCVDRPHPAEGILTRPVGVSGAWGKSRDSVPWLAVRTMASAGSAMEWMWRTLFPALSREAFAAQVSKTCRRLLRDGRAEGSLRCIPTFVGERASLEQPAGASFSGIRLGTDAEEMLAAVVQALADESAKNYGLLSRIRVPKQRVYSMGGASSVAEVMHAAWPKKHRFEQLSANGLRGLVMLAERTLE